MKSNRVRCFGIVIALVLSVGNVLAQEIVPLGRLFNYWDSALDVVVDGDYAYVATGLSGLQIVDISEPENPRVVGIFDDIDREMYKLVKVGTKVYALTEVGVHVVNVGNPPNPHEIGYQETGSFSWAIAVINDLLFVGKTDDERGAPNGSLWVYDVREPEEIALLDSIVFDNKQVNDIALNDEIALVAVGTRIIAYDVSNPEDLRQIGQSEDMEGPLVVAIDRDLAFVGGISGNYVFDVTDPTNIRNPNFVPSGRGCNDIQIKNNCLIYADNEGVDFYWYNGFDRYILRNRVRSRTRVLSACGSVNSLFMARGESGLLNLDITDPVSNDTIALLAPMCIDSGFVSDVKIWNGVAYCCKGNLSVLDLSDPINPSMINELEIRSSLLELDQNNALLYSSRGSFFNVVDVSDRRNPVLLGTYRGENILDFKSRDNFIFTTSCILDVSDPTHPIRRARFNQDRMMTTDCAVWSHYVFLQGLPFRVDTYPDMIVFDISNPDAPAFLHEGNFGLKGQDGCIFAHNGYLFASGWDNELVIIDATNPEEPSEVCRLHVSGSINDIAVRDDFLICTTIEGWILVIDINSPENPEIIDQYRNCFFTQAISVEGNIAAVAQGTSLRFYDLDGVRTVPILEGGELPFTGRLISAYPNPFNDRATIRIDMPNSAPMQLMLFDVSGRRFGEWTIPGGLKERQNQLILNGNSLPSGAFYLQAKTAMGNENARPTTVGRTNGYFQTLPITHLK